MGAALSLPCMALPSIGVVGSWIASCAGGAVCSVLCSACGKCASSIATRIGYALLFSFNSILSWIMLSDWAIKQLEKLTFNFAHIKCHGGECYGFVAVHRFNLALGLLHILLGCFLIGVRSTKNPRAALQNGWWGAKILAWALLVFLMFLIPDAFFVVWGNYFATAFASLFILIGLVLLVDCAHAWAELCLERIEASDSNVWRVVLVGSTFGMYGAAAVLTVLMYVFFASSGCAMNQAAITVNLLLIFAASVLSILPAVQEANPRAGLAQAAMVAVYCTYLTVSAVASEPDDKQCNPLVRSRGTRTASIVLGALFTLVAIAYTTTTAATRTSALGSEGGSGHVALPDSDVIVAQPDERQQLRLQAVQRAVDAGALPASALEDSELLNGEEDDEAGAVKYNYTLFHAVFFLATQWVATLLTMNLQQDAGDFVPVGRTYFSAWVKIVSAWVCCLLYVWTLIAPVLLPDRFGDY